ncbi:hypothetical protein CNR22_01290 [Sphingobacteriaceae bacterium]|nr:hypothetical protein CNR22_01290 [Sphingobacteriaceae bacterium]
MALANVFTKDVSEKIVSRIENLKADTQPQWGKMSVAQMLAHCNVTYELVYENKHPQPNFMTRLMLKIFVKSLVTTEKPYKRNSPTAPAFLIKEARNFQPEKQRLIDHIRKTQELGEKHFDNKVSHSFGPLSVVQWNNMFYKHLDHHLSQFAV